MKEEESKRKKNSKDQKKPKFLPKRKTFSRSDLCLVCATVFLSFYFFGLRRFVAISCVSPLLPLLHLLLLILPFPLFASKHTQKSKEEEEEDHFLVTVFFLILILRLKFKAQREKKRKEEKKNDDATNQ